MKSNVSRQSCDPVRPHPVHPVIPSGFGFRIWPVGLSICENPGSNGGEFVLIGVDSWLSFYICAHPRESADYRYFPGCTPARLEKQTQS